MVIGKQDNIDCMEINRMIEELTTGYLGKKIDDILDTFLYKNDSISMQYVSSKTHQLYSVYYNHKLVYQNIDGGISKVNKRKKYRGWIKEIYKIYKYYLEQKEIKNEKNKKRHDRDKKTRKVLKIFELVYPDGYADEKIIIDKVKKLTVNRFYLYTDGDYLVDDAFGGRITFLEGIVVYDKAMSIYQPGEWEDYVCDLVDKLEMKKEAQKIKKKVNM